MPQDRPAYGRHQETEQPARQPGRAIEPDVPTPSSAHQTNGHANQPYSGQTYYDRPAIKPSPYGWLIATYFFVGGLAGSAQILAAIADLGGYRRHHATVRSGRYLALVGSLLSPVLLIADLHTPQRWFNMMRIFRKTSAMSIGSWTLAVFGTFTGLTAAAQLWTDLTGSRLGIWVARIFGLPAAAAGAVMSMYTGTLLSATNVPLWAAVPRLLPSLFGASAASSAAAAISLANHQQEASSAETEALERFATVAAAAELGLLAATRHQLKQAKVDEPLREQPYRAGLNWGAVALGTAVPLALHVLQLTSRRRRPNAAVVAAVSTLAGTYALRAVVLFAGNRSATRPGDYFQLCQPGSLLHRDPPMAVDEERVSREHV